VGPWPSDLVLAAAEVTGLHPDDVLADTDVEVVVGIAERARDIDDPAAAASEVLVGVAAGRPFPRGNAATAWLAAMHELAQRGIDVEVHADDALLLVRAVVGVSSPSVR